MQPNLYIRSLINNGSDDLGLSHVQTAPLWRHTMNPITGYSVPSKPMPVSKAWINDNDINPEQSVILDYSGVEANHLLNNCHILIDSSQTTPPKDSAQLYLVMIDKTKVIQYVHEDEFGLIQTCNIDTERKTKGIIEMTELIHPDDLGERVTIIGKAFPITKTTQPTAEA